MGDGGTAAVGRSGSLAGDGFLWLHRDVWGHTSGRGINQLAGYRYPVSTEEMAQGCS